MKNIFKIHPISYLILISVLLAGYFNYFLIVVLILFCHDLGHVILIKFFKYKIDNILILPFGSIINSNINQNIPSIHLFLISIAGVTMQLLLFDVARLFLNDISYNIFVKYNLMILLFNLLPIIPLDGSKICQALLESFSSYKKTLIMINLFSLITIIFFLFYLGLDAFNALLVIVFLLYKTYESIINHRFIFNHFLLERFLNKREFKKVKYINSIKKIHKNKCNFINHNNEVKVLNNYFKK